MTEVASTVLGWLIPAIVVFGVAAIAVFATVWSVKRAHRSPRARARAETARKSAGVALVALDDAVADLDLEVGLSGALYGGGSPGTLRRARMTAQHVRVQAFEDYAALEDPTLLPAEQERRAARLQHRTEDAVRAIARARTEHADWVDQNVSAGDQVAAARRRLEALRGTLGDPDALVRDLSERFDPREWPDAARAAKDAVAAVADAGASLDSAASAAADPSRSALPDLSAAERALRRAESDARSLEETHRMISQSAQALPDEFLAARDALRLALVLREELPPMDADRLGEAIREVEASVGALEPDAQRRPTYTVDRIAVLRQRLDVAAGDARTAQQRLRGARTALPGTLASARSAIAHAETAVAHGRTGADARVRLSAAQDDLARARTADDAVAALDIARRAIRHAEDAKALADYDRLTAGR